ncbi:MAG: FAD-binding oxidoreductase [Xanthomonadales bacterium]|nr:FAD-binding oxidoreductase [Xanthomonadales bacterium]
MTAQMSWGRAHRLNPAQTFRVSKAGGLDAALILAKEQGLPITPYGQGRSYGDSCLSDGGILAQTDRLDCFENFDRDSGLLRAQAGVTIGAVLEASVPHGWFIPVSPGTRFVSLGGAVANDVHGKNHHQSGSFGHHVTGLGLTRSDSPRRWITPESDPRLWKATIGGLGLTGFIDSVEIQLSPIQSAFLAAGQTRFRGLDQFQDLSRKLEDDHQFLVAWIDGSKLESPRGILFWGDFERDPQALGLPGESSTIDIPLTPPLSMIGRITTGLFNNIYYHAHRPRTYRCAYPQFFYPLDRLNHWNRLYGPRGFYQHQSVLPLTQARTGIQEMAKIVDRYRQASALSVLKLMGDSSPAGYLSFAAPGFTLALDFPNRGDQTLKLLAELEAVVLAHGGRIYPAKDGQMSAAAFQAMYPQWEKLAKARDPAFSSAFWERVSRS